MGQIGGIYVVIDGDTVPLQQAMARARGIVREAAGEIGTSLNGALSGGQINAGLNSLVGNLQKLQGASKLTGDSFKGVGVSLKEVQGITGLTDAQFKTIQERMLQTSAQKAAEGAYRALQSQTGMTTRELQALGIQAPKVSSALQGVGGSSSFLTGSLMSLGAVVAGGLGLAQLASLARQSITTFMDFEKAISLVRSVAGATDDQMKLLAGSAREMATVSTFAAREVAQGQYYLASAGMNTNQIMQAQVGVLMLAQATQTDLAFASETVSSALSQFNLAASESARVANVYAAACATSQATVQKLSDSMRYVGPVAKSLGMDLETTVASLDLLYDAGLRGEQAGTGLRSAMLKLQTGAGEMADTFRDLGIVWRNADGTVRPFLEVLAQLRAKNLDAATAAKLFGTESATAVLTLAKNLDKLEEAKQKITGTQEAYKQAAEQMNALWADVKKLGSAFADLGISIGAGFAPYLRSAVQDATQLLNILSRGITVSTNIKDLNLLNIELAKAEKRLEELQNSPGALSVFVPSVSTTMIADQATTVAVLRAKIQELQITQRAAAGELDDYTARLKAVGAAGQEAAAGVSSTTLAAQNAAARLLASAQLEADKTIIASRTDSLDKTVALIGAERAIRLKAIAESNDTDLEKEAKRKALEVTTGAEIVAARTTWGRKYAEVALSNEGDLLAARQQYADYTGDIDQQAALARLKAANELQAKMLAAENAGTYNAQYFDELRNLNAAKLDREWADRRAAAAVALNETMYGLGAASADQMTGVYQADYQRRLDIIDQSNASEAAKLQQRWEAYKTLAGRLQNLTSSEESTLRAMLEAGAATPQALVDLYNRALAQAVPGTRDYYDLVNKLRQADLDAAGKYSDRWMELTIQGYQRAYQQGKISAQEYWTQVYELEKNALERHQKMLDARIALEKTQLQTSKKNWDSAWTGITEGARVAFDDILANQKSWGTLSYDAWKETYASMTDFLGSGFVDVVKLDFEKLEDDAQSFMDAILKAWMNMLAQMVAQWAISGIASLLNSSFNLGINITGNNLSSPGGILGTLGTGASLVSGGKTLAGLLGWGAPAVTAAGLGGDIYAGIATQVAEMYAAEQAGTASYLIAEGGATGGAAGTGILAGLKGALSSASSTISSWFSGTATPVATQAATATGQAAGQAMSLGLGTTLAWVGGAVGVAELMAKLTGGVGPVGAMMSLITGERGGHTKESAVGKIKGDMEAITRMGGDLDKVMAMDVTGGWATQRTLDDVKLAADEIKLLGERAGLTKSQLDLLFTGSAALEKQLAMAIDNGDKAAAAQAEAQIKELQAIQAATGLQGLDGQSALSAQIAQISDALGPRIQAVVQEGADRFGSYGGAVQGVANSMVALATSMELPQATTEALTVKVQDLVSQWENNKIATESLSAYLREAFVTSLQSAGVAGTDLTTVMQSMSAFLQNDMVTGLNAAGLSSMDLAQALESIPPEITSLIKIVYQYEGEPPDQTGTRLTDKLPSYDVGGWIAATGPAYVHAEEYMLNHQNIADLRSGKLHLGLPETAPRAAQPVTVRGGDVHLTVVTPDGQELRREVLRAASRGPAPQRLRIEL